DARTRPPQGAWRAVRGGVRVGPGAHPRQVPRDRAPLCRPHVREVLAGRARGRFRSETHVTKRPGCLPRRVARGAWTGQCFFGIGGASEFFPTGYRMM